MNEFENGRVSYPRVFMPCVMWIVEPYPCGKKHRKLFAAQQHKRKPFKWFKFNRARKATVK